MPGNKKRSTPAATTSGRENESTEDRAARVARERATEDAAAEAIKKAKGNSKQSPFDDSAFSFFSNPDPEALEAFKRATTAENFERVMQLGAELIEQTQRAIEDSIKAFIDGPDADRVESILPDLRDWIEDDSAGGDDPFFTMIAVATAFCYADDLPEYMEANNIEPSMYALTALTWTDDDGKERTPLEAFLSIQQEKDSSENAEIVNVIAHRPKSFGLPVDRINSKIWNVDRIPESGKVNLRILTKPGDKKEPSFFYSIDFNTVVSDFPIIAQLTAFDLRVCVAFGALMDAGNEYFTDNQIFKLMGHKRNATQSEKDAINESLTKMTARTHIDNKAEVSAGYKYKEFKYDGDFLSFERVTGVRINGKDTDTAIHAFRYPAVLQLAAERKQLQRVPIEVLQTDASINRSDLIIRIEDYLNNRIADGKRRGNAKIKIKYDTLYDKMKINQSDRKAKLRVRDYSQRHLAHCKKVNWIQDYKTDSDGLEVIL